MVNFATLKLAAQAAQTTGAKCMTINVADLLALLEALGSVRASRRDDERRWRPRLMMIEERS